MSWGAAVEASSGDRAARGFTGSGTDGRDGGVVLTSNSTGSVATELVGWGAVKSVVVRTIWEPPGAMFAGANSDGEGRGDVIPLLGAAKGSGESPGGDCKGRSLPSGDTGSDGEAIAGADNWGADPTIIIGGGSGSGIG